MGAYTAYLAFAHQLRFGKSTQEDVFAKQIMQTSAKREPSDLLRLAQATMKGPNGDAATALAALQSLAGRQPNDSTW